MNDLKKYKFNNLYDFTSGLSSTPAQAGHGAPFLSFSTVFNNHFVPEELPDKMDTSEKEQELFSIKEGDVFLTRTSETIDELGMSCVAISDYPKATYSGFVKRLRPLQNDITYHKFMAYYLRSNFFRKTMTNNAVLTLRASLNEQIFSYLDLLLPTYPNQVKIGDLLFVLTQKIQTNEKINVQLEKLTKTVYDYWFVQFDFPDKSGKPYKSSGGEMVWNEKLKKNIPKNWGVENLIENSLTELIKPGIKIFQEKKRYLTTSDVVGTDINFQANFIDYATRESRANMQPVANSVWFAKMKNSKKVMFVGDYSDYLADNYIFSTGFAGIKCMNEYALEYIWGCINSDAFEFLKDRLSNGATQEAINNGSMKSMPLLVPTGDVLKKYNEKTRQIYKTIYLREIENVQLTNLRDWLLPMLMNGQVVIK